MLRDWEGNRRSGVALFIHLRAQRPRVGDEHPAYALAGAWFPLPLTVTSKGREKSERQGREDGEGRWGLQIQISACATETMYFTALSNEFCGWSCWLISGPLLWSQSFQYNASALRMYVLLQILVIYISKKL